MERIFTKHLLAAVRKQAVAMVDAAITEGIDAQGRMLNGTEGNQVLEWWPQAETVIGCINAWQITGQEKYFRAAERSGTGRISASPSTRAIMGTPRSK